MMDFRYPVYTGDGRIDCEVNHPRFGWIPFTASPDDPASAAIFVAASAAGPVAYVEPLPEELPVPANVSAFQAKAALLDAGLLADVEMAVAGAGPRAVLAWEYATEFQRSSPTIAALAAGAGITDDMLDDLFRAAAQIRA